MDVERRRVAGADVTASDRGQPGIQHHPQRRQECGVVAVVETDGQLRVVGQHRAGAGEQRTRARAPAHHVATRGFAADPFRIAIGQRGAAVQAGRQLDPHPRPLSLDPRQEALIQAPRRIGHQPVLHRDAGRFQRIETRAVDLRKRVAHRRDHAGDAGRSQRIRAGAGLAGVRAGFEGHVSGGAPRPIARGLQRDDFGVRATGLRMPAFRDHLVAVRDHAADHRIRPRGVGAAFGQAQRPRHHRVVGRTEPVCRSVGGTHVAQRFFLSLSACRSKGTTSPPSSGNWVSDGSSRSRRSSSSRKSATSSNER